MTGSAAGLAAGSVAGAADAGSADAAWTRAVCTIDLDAVAANVAELRRRAGGAEVMAMVKADAYGHGLLPVAQVALGAGASWLGVAFVSEAARLREAGITVPVLALIINPGEELAPAVAAEVDLSVSAPWAVEAAAKAADRAGRPARLHLELDTGMTRGGAPATRWRELVESALKAQADGTVEAVGVWSHLVEDDPRHPGTDLQAAAFLAGLQEAERAGLHPAYRHLAKSTAVLHRPDLAFDLVRPGLAVYGLTTGGAPPSAVGLRPAMSLTAKVALTGRAPAGTGVSYGHRHVTTADTGVALVPLGYADGVPRVGTNVLEVLIGGRRRRVAGSMCMDQFTVETADDMVREGDEVLLFGSGDRGEPTAQEWAEATGTIDYEIVTRVGARVPRRYVGGQASPARTGTNTPTTGMGSA